MQKNNIVIEAKGLKKSYGTTNVLKGINLSVERGTMVALLGPNGAGKTTTVRILSTLLNFDGGEATIEGHNVVKEADKVRSVIGLTGQSAAVDELLTGRENLVMMGRLYRLTKKSATARANELLKDFDLVDAADRPAKTYSGGMRRRLDLAVSLIATPPVIFLDEPTTGLHFDDIKRLLIVLNALVDKGNTVLVIEHIMDIIKSADWVIDVGPEGGVYGGEIVGEGTPEEVAKVKDSWTGKYLKEAL